MYATDDEDLFTLSLSDESSLGSIKDVFEAEILGLRDEQLIHDASILHRNLTVLNFETTNIDNANNNSVASVEVNRTNSNSRNAKQSNEPAFTNQNQTRFHSQINAGVRYNEELAN